MSTHGSQLVRLQHPHLMQAGASARERIKEAAAKAWGVERSVVAAKQACSKRAIAPAPMPSSRRGCEDHARQGARDQDEPGKWWLLGQPTQRLDIPLKVNGSAQYAIDTRVPGMVYAAVKASPVPWGALKSYNFDAIKSRPGVIAAVELKAVPGKRGQPDLQNAVAVVADTWYRAKTALDLMPIEWDFGDSAKASTASLYAEGRRLMDRRASSARTTRRRSRSSPPRRRSSRRIRAAVRNARPHGADQRDRACAGGPRRCVVADAGPVGRDPAGCRPARRRSEECLRAHDVPGRRLRRQRRRRHRRDPPGGGNLEAGRKAGEGAVVARRGHRAGQAAAAGGCAAERRHRRRRSARRALHARDVVLPGRHRPDRGATADYGIYNMPYKFRTGTTSGTTRRPTSRARRTARRAPTSSAS